jgi:Na+-transporting NADH:ubiquinone oxidoreductase subunit B
MPSSPGKPVALIQWQPPMTRVLWALAPALVASVWFFGWRSLATLAVANVCGFLAEWVFARYNREPVTSAVFVTSTLFALILPPSLPFWMAAVGIVFGVVFGKMVFGGFGRNVFNPALVGRAFIYVNFTVAMNNRWHEPPGGALGGLVAYAPDTVCSATPIAVLKAGGEMPWMRLLLGNTAGCLGETSALLLILGGAWLLWKKTANRTLVAATIGSFLVLHGAFWLSGMAGVTDPLRAMLSGGFLLGAFFMATDPVSATKTEPGRWLYGILIGGLTVVIRTFSVWPEGFMFAVLLANMFGPIIDFLVGEWQQRGKAA